MGEFLPHLRSLDRPPPGHVKANFDVFMRNSFSVAAAVLSDDQGGLLLAKAVRIPLLQVNSEEA